jgi:hypothetical protein
MLQSPHMDSSVDKNAALSKLELLKGKKVSAGLNAYGYILYLEFGKLNTTEEVSPGGKKFKLTKGEYTLAIDGHWKFIEDKKIKIDSTTAERREIDFYLNNLLNAELISFSIAKDTFTTEISFSNGSTLIIEENMNDPRLWAINSAKDKKWFSFNKEVSNL